MPGFNLEAFKANFRNAAKQYLFYIYINNPVSQLGTERTVYFVRSSSIPEGTIDPIETAWQGMTYKQGSTFTFSDWTVTFAVDPNATIHDDFEDWQKLIHDPETNIQGNPDDYMRDQEVHLLNGQGEPIKKFQLRMAWPTSVGELTLDYSAKEIATFDVTFSYQFHKRV